MGIAMMIGAVIIAWVAGIIIGAAIAWDRAYAMGRSYGYQLGAERRDDENRLDLLRRLM